MKRLTGKGIWAVLALLYGACAWGQSNPGLNNPAGVPGHTTSSPSETKYIDGNMSGAAASRATSGTGMDTEAAKFVTGSATTRAQIPTTRASDWLTQAESTQKSADTMIQMLKGNYGGCTGGNVVQGATRQEYVYTCRGNSDFKKNPSGLIQRACTKTLNPRCLDPLCAVFGRSQTSGLREQGWGQYLYNTLIGGSSSFTVTADIKDLSKITNAHYYINNAHGFLRLTVNGSVVDQGTYVSGPQYPSAYVAKRISFRSYLRQGKNTIQWSGNDNQPSGMVSSLTTVEVYFITTCSCKSNFLHMCCNQWSDDWVSKC